MFLFKNKIFQPSTASKTFTIVNDYVRFRSIIGIIEKLVSCNGKISKWLGDILVPCMFIFPCRFNILGGGEWFPECFFVHLFLWNIWINDFFSRGYIILFVKLCTPCK